MRRPPTTTNFDVLLAVLEYTDKADLPALCRVNSIFLQATRDVLYRHFTHPKVVGACQAMLTFRHLASLVESFEINTQSVFEDDSINAFEKEEEKPFWVVVAQQPSTKQLEVLSSAMKLMHNMHTLKLLREGRYTHILDSCATALNLRAFHCGLYPDIQLYRFIISQPNITELRLMHAGRLEGLLGPSHLQHLNTFEAPFSLAEILVTGRPIQDLQISTFLTSASLAFISRSTRPIKSLRVPLRLACKLSASDTAKLLPEIEELVIDNYGHTEGFTTFHLNWCKEFVSIHGTLKSFTLHGASSPLSADCLDDLNLSACEYMQMITSTAPRSLAEFCLTVHAEDFSRTFSWTRVNSSWRESVPIGRKR